QHHRRSGLHRPVHADAPDLGAHGHPALRPGGRPGAPRPPGWALPEQQHPLLPVRDHRHLPGALRRSRGPRRAGGGPRRAQRRRARDLHRARRFLAAPGGVRDLVGTRQRGGVRGRRRHPPDPGRPQPRDLDRLHWAGSGDQLRRPVELLDGRVPDPAAAAVLHGAGERGLLKERGPVMPDLTHLRRDAWPARDMRARRRHPAAAGLAAMFLLLAIGGCDLGDLPDVPDPNKAPADDIDDPDNLPAVRAHAVGEFQVGYAGRGAANDNAFVLMSGLLSDEYEASGTFPTRVEVDQRNVRTTNTTAQQTFRIMHRGRAAAELSYRAHEMHAQGSPAQAEAAVLAGFMYNAFGEMYCSGVPFSRLDAADPEYGEPLATEQIFEEAIGWFDSAGSIATGPEAEDEALAAAVGRARALLNLGDVA